MRSRYLALQPAALPQRQASDQAEQGGHRGIPETAGTRVPHPTGSQRRGGSGAHRPDRSGLGRLLPHGGVQQGVRRAGRLPVEAHLQVGVLDALEQAETLDCAALLRKVRQVPGRPVGVRRPGDRRLSTEPGLEDRKSTRLNSSHVRSSYAVFCLKKKTQTLSYLCTYKKKKTNKSKLDLRRRT